MKKRIESVNIYYRKQASPLWKSRVNKLFLLTAVFALFLILCTAPSAAHDVGAGWIPVHSLTEDITVTGNYYLDDNITLTDMWTVPAGQEITLCLNGHWIKQTTYTQSVITVPGSGTKLIIDDCSNEKHYFDVDDGTGLWTLRTDGTPSDHFVTGGVITGGDRKSYDNYGGGVTVNKGAIFEMCGGNIAGNTARNSGGGVCINSGGTFTMSGGKIIGNALGGGYTGGGVNNDRGTFTMSGGSIAGNTAKYLGSDYFVAGGSSYMSGDAKIDKIYLDGICKFIIRGDEFNGGITNITGIKMDEDGHVVVQIDGSSTLHADDIIDKFTLADSSKILVASYNNKQLKIFDPHPSSDDWHPVASLTEITEAGKYYLTDNINLDDTWSVPAGEDVTLCLHGHWIDQTVDDKSVISVTGSETRLIIDDCTYKKHYFTVDETGLWTLIKDTTTPTDHFVTGGVITGGESESGNYGGGVIVDDGGTFIMSGGNIAGNTASTAGGGVSNRGTSATFTMSGGNIIGNTARNGGGVYNYDGTITMSGGNIAGNTATRNGGGVYDNGAFTMEGGDITGNTAELGGGVYNYDGSIITVTDGNIAGNTATENGGGVYNKGIFTMEGGEITLNDATGEGGGVYDNGAFTMEGGDITGNTANNGGGVYNFVNSIITVTDGNIAGNTATENGGGVYNKGTFTMEGGDITGNDATGEGGGVYATDTGIIEVSGDAKVSGNVAGESDVANNVYLADGSKITLGDDGLVDGASIGVTTQTDPTEESTVDVTDAVARANKKYFSADKSDQHIAYTDGKIVIAFGPPLPPGNDDIEIIYNNLQRYVVSIPDDINFEEDAYEYDNFVSVTEMWLEIGKQINVSVRSNNGFKMIQGEPEAPASYIKYTMTLNDEVTPLEGTGFTPILFAEAGKSKEPEGYHAKSDLHYEVTSEALAAAKFAGEHKDTLTFKVEVEDI